MPTPATNTDDGLDLHLALNNLESTHQLHSCLSWTMRVPGTVSNLARKEKYMMIQHTRAIHDNTSSGPMPAPRSRPSKRRDTTKANMTHNTLIVMRASRACLVISTFLISVMLEDVRVRQWRWMQHWGNNSSHVWKRSKAKTSYAQRSRSTDRLQFGSTVLGASPVQGT